MKPNLRMLVHSLSWLNKFKFEKKKISVFFLDYYFNIFYYKDGSKQAENNLKFLLVLKDPCHELADAKPVDIPKQLPRIINIIRVIWTNSDYYNTGDRLTAMFRKVKIYQIKLNLI